MVAQLAVAQPGPGLVVANVEQHREQVGDLAVVGYRAPSGEDLGDQRVERPQGPRRDANRDALRTIAVAEGDVTVG